MGQDDVTDACVPYSIYPYTFIHLISIRVVLLSLIISGGRLTPVRLRSRRMARPMLNCASIE